MVVQLFVSWKKSLGYSWIDSSDSMWTKKTTKRKEVKDENSDRADTSFTSELRVSLKIQLWMNRESWRWKVSMVIVWKCMYLHRCWSVQCWLVWYAALWRSCCCLPAESILCSEVSALLSQQCKDLSRRRSEVKSVVYRHSDQKWLIHACCIYWWFECSSQFHCWQVHDREEGEWCSYGRRGDSE